MDTVVSVQNLVKNIKINTPLKILVLK